MTVLVQQEFFTLTEVARFLGKHPATVARWVRLDPEWEGASVMVGTRPKIRGEWLRAKFGAVPEKWA